MKNTMIRVPEQLLTAVDAYATKEGTSRNAVIAEVLTEAFPGVMPEGWVYEGRKGCAWRGGVRPTKSSKIPAPPRGVA